MHHQSGHRPRTICKPNCQAFWAHCWSSKTYVCHQKKNLNLTIIHSTSSIQYFSLYCKHIAKIVMRDITEKRLPTMRNKTRIYLAISINCIGVYSSTTTVFHCMLHTRELFSRSAFPAVFIMVEPYLFCSALRANQEIFYQNAFIAYFYSGEVEPSSTLCKISLD